MTKRSRFGAPARMLLGALSCALVGCSDAEGEAATRATLGAPAHARAEPELAVDSLCALAGAGVTLPADVAETSGLARSGRDTRVLWTHNDAGNDPELFAVDIDGRLLGRTRVAGASVVDWEDLEAAPCGASTCLYVADIGDNGGERDGVTVYRVPEPAVGAPSTEAAVALHARFPDGPRDAEALFAGPDGTLYVVTKGRREPIALYRWPGSAGADGVGTLDRVRLLFPEPSREDDRVTAATATPDGRRVAIRTYRALHVYAMDALVRNGPVEPLSVDLSFVGHPQGESVVLSDEGDVWLTSEAEGGGRPAMARLRCAWPPT